MTNADRAVIEYAQSCGERVTARMLKRWRHERLLPPRIVHGAGRARGVVGVDQSSARYQAVAVSRMLRACKRNVGRTALRLWYDGWEIPTELIAAQIQRRLDTERHTIDGLRTRIASEQGIPAAEVSPFDIAEAHSRQTPVTHAEVARMKNAPAEPDETPTARVHATRAALEGQFLSPADEPSAIPEDLVEHYFDMTTAVAFLSAQPEISTNVFDQLEVAIQVVNPDDVYQAPQHRALESARNRLRLMHDVREMILSETPAPEPAELFEQVKSLATQYWPIYDPRDPRFTHDKLLAALNTVARMPLKYAPQ